LSNSANHDPYGECNLVLSRFLISRTQMQSDRAGLANRNNEALDVDGKAVASADQIATQGTFFAQTGNFEGTQRRLVFGDFDVQRDGDTGWTCHVFMPLQVLV